MNHSTSSRRNVLRVAGAAAVGAMVGAFPLRWVAAEDAKTKKVLFFTKSSGFQHSVVKRDKPEELSFAEKHLTEMGKANGFDVTCTKDGSVFTPAKLAEYDVVVFYTTGDLTKPGTDKTTPMPAEGKQALIDFVKGGKGYLGLHCASDTFHSPKTGPVDPYIKLIGGEFVTHHNQQKAKIIAVDKGFAPIKGLEDFEKNEEWYILKNFAPDLHVIFVQDTSSMDKNYNSIKPYPETWARKEEKGRVFYSSMGHREDVWESDIFKNVVLGGLAWAAGNVEADVTPNLKQVAPEAVDRIAS